MHVYVRAYVYVWVYVCMCMNSNPFLILAIVCAYAWWILSAFFCSQLTSFQYVIYIKLLSD